MLPECIPQTGQVLPNYPDRRLRRIRIINDANTVIEGHRIKPVRSISKRICGPEGDMRLQPSSVLHH